MQDATRSTGSRRTPRILEGKTHPLASQTHQQSMQTYQTGVQLMQEGKFDKARAMFEKIASGGPPEILERARVYLSVCERNVKPAPLAFNSPEEQYDYAISRLNTGDYEEARDHFEIVLRGSPSADYAFYGVAVLESMTGQVEECLEHLTRAIELNPRNRIQARSDSDFQDMVDDPRFTELLYPEVL